MVKYVGVGGCVNVDEFKNNVSWLCIVGFVRFVRAWYAVVMYQGRFLWESFYFNHPDPLKAQEAEVRYETYMREVGGVEEGGKDHEHLFLNKVCILSVYRGEYEGRPYNKVNSRTLTTPQGSGVYLPHPPQAMADLLDDEIPI